MLHWLHSFLPHVPCYGFVLVFAVIFLNNIGVPLPGKTILLGGGIYLGEIRGFVVATDGSRIGGLFPGRHFNGGRAMRLMPRSQSTRTHWCFFKWHDSVHARLRSPFALPPPRMDNTRTKT
jgi:hypothetical protein